MGFMASEGSNFVETEKQNSQCERILSEAFERLNLLKVSRDFSPCQTFERKKRVIVTERLGFCRKFYEARVAIKFYSDI